MVKGGVFLDGLYDIFRGGEKIGKAEIRQEGLYCRFRCVCDLSGQVIYRLLATWGEKEVNLGIPVPCGDAFRLDTKIAASRLGEGTPKFLAVPRHPEKTGIWVKVSPEEPFAYLQRLKNAVPEVRDGKMGIYIRDLEAPVPPGNGQNP